MKVTVKPEVKQKILVTLIARAQDTNEDYLLNGIEGIIKAQDLMKRLEGWDLNTSSQIMAMTGCTLAINCMAELSNRIGAVVTPQLTAAQAPEISIEMKKQVLELAQRTEDILGTMEAAAEELNRIQGEILKDFGGDQ